MKSRTLNLRVSWVAAWIASVFACGFSRANFIPLNLLDAPDILSGFHAFSFDAASDAFSANGFALEYDDDGVGLPENILNGSFAVTASINDLGVASSGSLAIGGNVAGVGPFLLTGDLVDFGYNKNGGTILEFLFQVTGGALAGPYGGIGTLFGVNMDVGAPGYSGDWSQSFTLDTGAAVSNTAPIPGPPVLALLVAAAAVGTRRRRRRF